MAAPPPPEPGPLEVRRITIQREPVDGAVMLGTEKVGVYRIRGVCHMGTFAGWRLLRCVGWTCFGASVARAVGTGNPDRLHVYRLLVCQHSCS